MIQTLELYMESFLIRSERAFLSRRGASEPSDSARQPLPRPPPLLRLGGGFGPETNSAIGQPLADDALQRRFGALHIIHANGGPMREIRTCRRSEPTLPERVLDHQRVA